MAVRGGGLSTMFTRAVVWIVLSTFALSVGAVVADDPSQFRHRFLEAERALESGNHSAYEGLLAELEGYPLYPYLVYLDLKKRLHTEPTEEIRGFLVNWQDTPLAERLRGAWLKRLAKRELWDEYLADYTGNDSVVRRCDYMSALIHTGRGESIFPEVEQLWLHPRSQPPECDPVFKAWRMKGHLTRNLVWARIRLAVDAGETALAAYLKRFVDVSEHADVDLWITTRKQPQTIAELHRYPAERHLAHQALVAGFQYLARRDPLKAAEVWTRVFTSRDWSEMEVVAIERQIGLSLAYRHEIDAIDWLSRVPYRDDQQVQEWRVLSALRHGNWKIALQWLLEMSEEEKQTSRWRYWRARCQQLSGDEAGTSSIYTRLAQERSYYGFLAADRAALPYRFQHQSLPFSDTDLKPVAALPGIVRAKELFLSNAGRMLGEKGIS